MSTLKEYQAEIVEWGKRMGWNDDRSIGELIALMHSELSEALEEYRNNHDPQEIYYGEDGKPEGIVVELADVVIRILHFCALFDVDLAGIVRLKQDYNHKRKFRHGGKRL